jgi:hypothetical protein
MLLAPFLLWAFPLSAGDFLVSPEAASNIRINQHERFAISEHIRSLDISPESKKVFIDMIDYVIDDTAAGADYVPPGVTVIDGNYEALCAKVVSRLFWAAFGNEDDPATLRGVSGDAWNMAWNVTLFGGRIYPWDENAAGMLRTGDIVGIYYAQSIYNGIKKNRDYTHLALVIGNLPGRGPLIAHWWNIPAQFLPPGTKPSWFFRLEFLQDLLRDFPGLFEPREIIRPKHIFRISP